MPELKPYQQVKGEDLAIMGVAAQHQVNIALGFAPDRWLMDKGKVEAVIAAQAFNRLDLRRCRLRVGYADQIDTVNRDGLILQHCDAQLRKPREHGFKAADIAFMIAGDEKDIRLDSLQRRDVLKLEIAAVEEVTADQQRIDIGLSQMVTDRLKMARRVRPDMNITDEGKPLRTVNPVS